MMSFKVQGESVHPSVCLSVGLAIPCTASHFRWTDWWMYAQILLQGCCSAYFKTTVAMKIIEAREAPMLYCLLAIYYGLC